MLTDTNFKEKMINDPVKRNISKMFQICAFIYPEDVMKIRPCFSKNNSKFKSINWSLNALQHFSRLMWQSGNEDDYDTVYLCVIYVQTM